MQNESKAVQELLNAIPCSCELHSEGHYDHCTKQRVRAVLAELAAEKEHSEWLAKSVCQMEDALGFKQDQCDKDGAFVPTIGPWLERVLDLIAKEGELGDVREQLAACQAKCAEMRLVITHCFSFMGECVNCTPHSCCEDCRIQREKMEHALSSSCGTGYVPVSELEPLNQALLKLQSTNRCNEFSKEILREALNYITALKGSHAHLP